MTDDLSDARRLVLDLVDLPELLADADADGDLVSLGLNSGDLLRVAAAVEERTGTALGDEELSELHTLDGIRRVLAAHGSTGSHSIAGER